GDRPVHDKRWSDANDFAMLLTKKFSMPFSLPTEAMWEKAASWDSVYQTKRRFPWGDEEDPSRCNTIESRRNSVTPIGTFSPACDSPYGIQDMVGNVWEWTSSALYPQPYFARDGRETDAPSDRILRGSSFHARRGFRNGCTTRLSFAQNYAFDDAGFR